MIPELNLSEKPVLLCQLLLMLVRFEEFTINWNPCMEIFSLIINSHLFILNSYICKETRYFRDLLVLPTQPLGTMPHN